MDAGSVWTIVPRLVQEIQVRVFQNHFGVGGGVFEKTIRVEDVMFGNAHPSVWVCFFDRVHASLHLLQIAFPVVLFKAATLANNLYVAEGFHLFGSCGFYAGDNRATGSTFFQFSLEVFFKRNGQRIMRAI